MLVVRAISLLISRPTSLCVFELFLMKPEFLFQLQKRLKRIFIGIEELIVCKGAGTLLLEVTTVLVNRI